MRTEECSPAPGAQPAPHDAAAVAETEALARARAGDGEAFGHLVLRYRNYVYTLIVRHGIFADDADDLFQESFLRAFRSLGSYRPELPFKNWLCTITLNCIRSRMARTRVRRLFGMDRSAPPDLADTRASDPSETLEVASKQRALGIALAALPETYRRILLLCYYEKASYEAIAAELGLPLGTVKTHLFRAKEALRRKLKLSEGPPV